VQLANRLFNVTIEPADGEAPVWHPDVRFFKVLEDGKPKAYFYLDPYSRPAGVCPSFYDTNVPLP
jgi:oligopeptidase A